MSIGVMGVQGIIEMWAANPSKVLPMYREAYPGITDDEALALINLFTGLYTQPFKTQKEWDAKQKAYSKAVEATKKKYPDGVFPSLMFPAVDTPLIDIEL